MKEWIFKTTKAIEISEAENIKKNKEKVSKLISLLM